MVIPGYNSTQFVDFVEMEGVLEWGEHHSAFGEKRGGLLKGGETGAPSQGLAVKRGHGTGQGGCLRQV
jgi:hypothetical protein